MPVRRRFAARFYSLPLLCAPRDFRREYGDSMWRDVADNLAEEHLLHGSFAAFFYYAGACSDLVACGLHERGAMMVRDIVFALSALRKNPLFSLVVIATLALALVRNVARALAGNPAVLLADEPTGNLDSSNARRS